MKIKIIIAFVLSLFSLNIFADDFNYTSIGQCTEQMLKYRDDAMDLAGKHEVPSKEWEGFMNMSLFFGHFSSGSSTRVVCEDNICTEETSLACDLLELKPLWQDLVIPLLNKEVNQYLNQKNYDPNITPDNTPRIKCTYPEGHPAYDHCQFITV